MQGPWPAVVNFDEMLWKHHLEQTAFEVVRQKFVGSNRLSDILLSTCDEILAEASKKAIVRRIGLDQTYDRAYDPSQWCGRNVLGQALMRVRRQLRGEHVVARPTDNEETEEALAGTEQGEVAG